MTSPGKRALRLHNLAHRLRKAGIPILPGLISQLNLALHGIDIDPGAVVPITTNIPHPVGIVIGGWVCLEDDCMLWPGVVLGGSGSRTRADGNPYLERCVAVGAGAKILGRIRVGAFAVVGANAVVLDDVPPGVTVFGAPARMKASLGDGPGATRST